MNQLSHHSEECKDEPGLLLVSSRLKEDHDIEMDNTLSDYISGPETMESGPEEVYPR